METTGALKMELVDFVFSKFCNQNRIKEDILNMMEQFGLIVNFAPSPGDELYFVPCQLKTPPACFSQVEPSLQYHSLSQTIFEMAQFKMSCGTYEPL